MRTAEEEEDLAFLQRRIKSAFPDTPFGGPITPVDGQSGEVLDEEHALYSALHGRKWSDVSASFIAANPDGVVLLTDASYAIFLPAWLTCALRDKKVREMMVYAFSPRKPTERMRRRIGRLTSEQRDVLIAFLAYCAEIESAKVMKEAAQRAIVYVTTEASE